MAHLEVALILYNQTPCLSRFFREICKKFENVYLMRLKKLCLTRLFGGLRACRFLRTALCYGAVRATACFTKPFDFMQ